MNKIGVCLKNQNKEIKIQPRIKKLKKWPSRLEQLKRLLGNILISVAFVLHAFALFLQLLSFASCSLASACLRSPFPCTLSKWSFPLPQPAGLFALGNAFCPGFPCSPADVQPFLQFYDHCIPNSNPFAFCSKSCSDSFSNSGIKIYASKVSYH